MLRPPVNQDRYERNFDVVSGVLGNHVFPFRVGGVLHVQLITQIPGGLASQQVDIQRFRIWRPRHAELDLGHRHGKPRCKARSMERSRAVTGERPWRRTAEVRAQSAQMYRKYSAWKLSPDKSRNVHAAVALASHGGQISSPRRRRYDKCVIAWPLRSAGRRPVAPSTLLLRARSTPTALNPLAAIEGSHLYRQDRQLFYILRIPRATRVQFDSTSNSFVENRHSGDAAAVSPISPALLIATARPAP